MTRRLILISILVALGCTPDREPLPVDHPANPAAREPLWTAPEDVPASTASPAPGVEGHGGHQHHGAGGR